jgi:hypothetical protein
MQTLLEFSQVVGRSLCLEERREIEVESGPTCRIKRENSRTLRKKEAP